VFCISAALFLDSSASSAEGEFLLGQPAILWRWKTLRRQSATEFACWVYAPSSFSVSETASRLVFGTMANNPDDVDLLNSDDDKMGDAIDLRSSDDEPPHPLKRNKVALSPRDHVEAAIDLRSSDDESPNSLKRHKATPPPREPNRAPAAVPGGRPDGGHRAAEEMEEGEEVEEEDYKDQEYEESDDEDEEDGDGKDERVPAKQLNMAEQQAILTYITNPSDRTLQKMLFAERFFFELKPHQFAGVRYVCGCGSTWPSEGQGVKDLPYPLTHGGILADQMGLGKTVESLAGCVLRHAAAAAKCAKATKPKTLIITPNDAVSEQWKQHLLLGGVTLSDIYMAGKTKLKSSKDLGKKNVRVKPTQTWQIMTRYYMSAKMQVLIKTARLNAVDDMKMAQSPFWPGLSKPDAKKLVNLYYAPKGRKKRGKQSKDENYIGDMLRFFKAQRKKDREATWCTVVIDEAHFLKNPLTFWGVGAGLLGCHAQRVICATGTS